MHIQVNQELKAYIDLLTLDEFKAMERSLLAEGCRDALKLWGDLLVDGHNRYVIFQQHNLPFHTEQNTRFQFMDYVHFWKIDQHLGRRSESDFQRGVLALRKREIMAAQRSRFLAAAPSPQELRPDDAQLAPHAGAPVAPAARLLHCREDIARARGRGARYFIGWRTRGPAP